MYIIENGHYHSPSNGVRAGKPDGYDSTRAHRNNYDDIPELSGLAIKDLERWYCQDIEFYKYCEGWMMKNNSSSNRKSS